MPDPIEHIYRSLPPWRANVEAKTECGKRAIDVAAVITFDALLAKVKAQGQQRAAMSTCMTCWGRCDVRSPRSWEVCPSVIVGRDADSYHGWGSPHQDTLLDRELRAVAALVEAHRDEFDAYLSGLDSTVSLADARAKRKPKTVATRMGPRPL